MSKDDTPNLPNSKPPSAVDLDAELTAQAKKIVPWGTGWRYSKSDFPYEMAGVMHPVALKNRNGDKKHIAKIMAGGPQKLPPDTHPALIVRGFMEGLMDYWSSKTFCHLK